jgi:hypothetical protein
VAIAEREALLHLIDVTHDAFAFRPRYVIIPRAAERDLRAQTADGKPDAAETTTETAVKVEEPQMQSRRNRYRYALRHWYGRAPQKIKLPGFFVVTSAGFSKTYTSLQCATPGRVGNLDKQDFWEMIL